MGRGNAAIALFGRLDHLVQMIVQSRTETEFSGRLADLIKATAHRFKCRGTAVPARREDHQVFRAEYFEELDGLASRGDYFAVTRRIVGWSIERNRDHLQATARDFPLHLVHGDVVRRKNLRKLR